MTQDAFVIWLLYDNSGIFSGIDSGPGMLWKWEDARMNLATGTAWRKVSCIVNDEECLQGKTQPT